MQRLVRNPSQPAPQQQQHQQQQQQAQQQQPPPTQQPSYPPTSKVRRPTDRSLPPFDPQHDPLLADLASRYADLVKMERKLDWTYSRKRVEMAEQLSDKGGAKLVRVVRTLRLKISNTCTNQPWQQQQTDSSNNTANNESLSDPIPDFSTGQGIPSWTLLISGQLLPEISSSSASTQAPPKFTSLIRSLTIELPDRQSEIHRDPNIVNFVPEPAQQNDTISLTQTGSESVTARISIILDQTPEKYKLHPELAAVLGYQHDTMLGVVSALWAYVKKERLQDTTDKRLIKTDATLQKLFKTDKIYFQQFPEYIQKYMSKADPIVLNYMIDITPDHESKSIIVDIDFETERATKMRLAHAYQRLFNHKDGMEAIVSADEKIATDAGTVRSTLLKRDFLTAFARSPVEFLQTWLDSQARDLEVALGTSDRARQRATSIDETAWRTEKRRRAEFYHGDWLQDSINVHQIRAANANTHTNARVAPQQLQQQLQPHQQLQQHHQLQLQQQQQQLRQIPSYSAVHH